MPAWPYARGWVARRLPDESRTPDLERAEAHDHLSARVRPVRGITMPSPERGHAVPAGLHMPPRDHVETLPGQRQQRRTVLGEQATFLRVLAAMRFRGQLQAPVRQPGVEVLQAPYARPGREQLAPRHADLGLHRALPMTGIRVAERTIEPVTRLEGPEQARQARLAPRTPYGPRRRRYRTRSAPAHRPATRTGRATPGTCTQRSRPASTAPDRRSNTGNQARNDASAAPRRATARRPRRNRPAPRPDAIPGP